MKMLLLLIAFLLCSVHLFAQTYQWAENIGGSGLDFGKTIALDASGNVCVAGVFSGTVDFDPGANVAEITATNGGGDIFFAKYDAEGNYLWAKNISSATVNDFGNSIAIDASDNIYITGTFQGTADFDPGAGVVNLGSQGYQDMFFAKYDAQGNYIWAHDIGGTDYYDQGESIVVDAAANIFITGSFRGTVDFDPGAGIANLTAAAYDDIFIAKYDSGGNYLWAKKIGGSDSDDGLGIALDEESNVYVTGYFYGDVDFDPGPGSAVLNGLGCFDIFFAKYDSSGNYAWAHSIGSDPYYGDCEEGLAIAIDHDSNVLITGYFWYPTADFDPGPNVFNLTSVTNGDTYFAKYTSDGDFIWAKSIGDEAGTGMGRAIGVDDFNNIYLTGHFAGPADFDPGPGTVNINTSGWGDWNTYFGIYDSQGNYQFAANIGYSDGSVGNGIAIDPLGSFYITGQFYATCDFDPDSGIATLTSNGDNDVFIAKYSEIATGINQETKSEISALKIFPNPAADQITIAGHNAQNAVRIFNLLGQQVLSSEIKMNSEETFTINVESLPVGIYKVMLVGEERMQEASFVKE